MNKTLENLIDKIVKLVDEGIFEDYFNQKTALDPDQVDAERDLLRDVLEPYVDDSEFLESLKKAGVENTDEYEDAVTIFGRPLYD